jgi:hypothetical protein
MSAGVFLSRGLGGESGLYGNGAAAELAWHFRLGQTVEGRLRGGLFTLGSGTKLGRFDRPFNASSSGVLVAWDWVFQGGPGIYGILGLGGGVYRYRYDEVPGTMAFPDTPARAQSGSTGVGIACAGVGVAVNRTIELELRYTLAKDSVVVAYGPLGEAFAGPYFNPAPSHLGLGVRWRF